YKKEWIDWAVGRPEVGCRFNPPPDPEKSWSISVEEVYRDVAILRLEKPGRLRFEGSGDLAGGDNGELGEALRPRARPAKKEGAGVEGRRRLRGAHSGSRDGALGYRRGAGAVDRFAGAAVELGMRKQHKVKPILLATMFVASLAHADVARNQQQPPKAPAKRV